MPRKKHVPPSKKRYDEQHPTVSARVPRELYDQLQQLKELSGKSLADVLKEALGAQGPSTRAAYNQGLVAGRREAEQRYRVNYRCRVCGGTLTIQSREEKEAISDYMRERGWAHSACLQ